MSKIYEALLRAELERQAGTGDQQPGPTEAAVPAPAENGAATRNLSASASPAARPRRSSDLMEPTDQESRSAESTMTDDLSVSDVSYGASGLNDIDLSLVPNVVWAPEWPRLPSLLERGASVEQFRGLRSRINEFRDLNTLKSVLISSGLPEEGKSYVAMNIALSFARHNASRVLLIDGDMRRGTLHKFLGTRSEPGLTEYLSGKATLPEVMQRPVSNRSEPLPKGLATLMFLPCGGDAENASDLSGNGRFSKLLEQAGPLFDWIIIDSSPVTLVADGANLARVCDGTLLITRDGKTDYKTAQRALSELKAAKVIGVVMNAVVKPPRVGGYYGYDAYEKTT